MLAACCAVAAGLMLPGAAVASQRSVAAPAAVPGELLVKFTRGATGAERRTAVGQLGGQIISSIPDLSVDVVRFASASSSPRPLAATLRVAGALAHSARVVYAEPNGIDHALLVPDDPDVTQDPTNTSLQWALPTIDAFGAWGVSEGSPTTKIAIVDTGIDTSHPDLAGKVVDGVDIADSNNSFEDNNGHGTGVAGITAADTNNGIGIAGMCPRCSLLAVKALNADGGGTTAHLVQGITWAADHGARVINLSVGGGSSATLDDAVEYAWGKGAFVACAAGNGGSSTPISPAEDKDCFAVAATDSTGAKASFSNFGSWVAGAAPGVSILSTNNSGSYSFGNGTSDATPYVAGLAGLLAANETNAAITSTICGTADQISGTGTDWRCGRIDAAAALSAMAERVPVTTLHLTPPSPNGNDGWYRSLHLTASGTARANGATIASVSCVTDPASAPATFFALPGGCAYGAAGASFAPDGAHTVYAASEDSAGYISSPVSASFRLDSVSPQVLCATPDQLWHGENVSFSCHSSDSTSGLADPAQSSVVVSTDVPSGDDTSSATTNGVTVCDHAGNCAIAQVRGIKIDRKPPRVKIRKPGKRAHYSSSSRIRVRFRCTDAGSGIASCKGTVRNGHLLPVRSRGSHSFTVIAKDRAGNTTKVTRSYTVTRRRR